MGYVVIQTDFGGGPCAPMTGMCKLVDPSLKVFDLTHDVPKFNVRAAGANLVEVMPFWPEGTVFVSVCDPGVGTPRKAAVAKTGNGYYIVTPDNGTLTDVVNTFGVMAIREIDESVNRFKGNEWSAHSDIFHGRDIFAYCAARLAAGIIDFEGVGPEYPTKDIIVL